MAPIDAKHPKQSQGRYSNTELIPLHRIKNIISVLFRLENIKSESDHLRAIETIRVELNLLLD